MRVPCLAVLFSLTACGPASMLLPADAVAAPGDLLLVQLGPLYLGEAQPLFIDEAVGQERVHVIASLAAGGTLACPPQLAGGCLDLYEPIRHLGFATASASGAALFDVMPPATLGERPVQFQLVQSIGGAIYTSEVLRTFFYARTGDLDGDGLSNERELELHGTDPDLADTDGGGVPDGEEVDAGTNPMDPSDDVTCTAVDWYADIDQDGYGDPEASVSACEAPLGYIADDNDCDDVRDFLHPYTIGASEHCGWRHVSAGGSHTCAVDSDEHGRCWGLNLDGRNDVPDGTYRKVVAGGRFSCGISTGPFGVGPVTCWGLNNFGQTNVLPGDFTDIDAGTNHVCGLRADYSVECWGSVPSGPPTGSLHFAVAAGFNASCALDGWGAASCWGGNIGLLANAPIGTTYGQIALHDRFACARRSVDIDGLSPVDCWGDNTYGQINAPAGVSFLSVDVGTFTACGLTSLGEAQCWGWDGAGQASPPDLLFRQIDVATYSGCGITTEGAMACWGDNDNGQNDVP